MQVVRSIPEVRAHVAQARAAARRVAFVPTMGALHEGHLSLVREARRGDAYVVVSIFVNPTQFAPGEDFSRYPRDEARDLQFCRRERVDLVFAPSAETMYPPGALTTVHVSQLADTLCGPHRPGHFDGVATVVAKLLNIVRPDSACFGEKDYQQLMVIRRMVRDLDLPVEIVGCPTVREPDGLAMSSRNAYLSPAERTQALSLYRSLCEAKRRVAEGERDPAAIESLLRRTLLSAGPVAIDYASVVDAETLKPVKSVDRPVVAAVAARIGATRLIDNLRIDPRAAGD